MVTDKKSDKKSGKNPPSGQTPPKQETGILTERVELPKPKSEHPEQDQAEEQPLLPHERDETTGPAGTGLTNQEERSREVIGQAAEDTQRGLKDTDRRGIPSDIVASDVPEPDTAPKNTPGGKGKKSDKGEKAGKVEKGDGAV
jgi:hypothetical protein